ncbi:hypothetical protein JCM31739_06400 [Faecalimonas canis]
MLEDSTLCKEQILSEDFRDFIYERENPYFLEQTSKTRLCEQEIGFYYRSVYVNKIFGDPMTLERFTYGSIPKCYTLLDSETLNQAGISQVQNYPTLQLRGEGVMIGIIDTGIDYENPLFKNADGTTRIAGIWDQTIQTGREPEGFLYGSEYIREEINEALQSDNAKEIVPTTDTDGHGTFVASVAAGGENVEEDFLGAAPRAILGIVKLKEAKKYLKQFYFINEEAKCYQENDIMLGMRYLELIAEKEQLPLIFCIPLGTNLGDHNGTSPLGNLLSYYSNVHNMAVVLGGGNEANQRHHYYGRLEGERGKDSVEIRVERTGAGFTLEMWTDIPNIFMITITSPAGERIPFPTVKQSESTSVHSFVFERTTVYVDYRLLVERTNSELAFIRFENAVEGIWKVEVEAIQVADGIFHMWLPVKEFLSGEVYFLRSNPDWTITEPGCVWTAMTAANYNGSNNSIAIDSGRGYTRNGSLKPDFAAPGINVTGATGRNQFVERSGSSISTAITAGASALLMEWLYYQLGRRNVDTVQIKNLLVLGTNRMDTEEYPNRVWGYGTLDLYKTFDELRSF